MSKQENNIAVLAQMFRILGDQTRLRILMELQDGQRNVTELCKKLKAPQPTVSHHLSILRMGQLVNSRRSGKEIFYSVSDLDKHAYGKAFAAMLKEQSGIRFGSLVMGLD